MDDTNRWYDVTDLGQFLASNDNEHDDWHPQRPTISVREYGAVLHITAINSDGRTSGFVVTIAEYNPAQ